MICPECGNEITKNTSKCTECGYNFKKTELIELKDNKKNVNKKFLIIIAIVIAIIVILWIGNIIRINIYLNSRSEIISKYCNSNNYIQNARLKDFIDNYSCEAFASYMHDTKGRELKESHYEKLISFNNESIYQIIKKFTKKEISEKYNKLITDYKYYKYLNETNNFSVITEAKYADLLKYSLEEKDYELWKTVIEVNANSTKYNWDSVKYYFGPNYTKGNYESLDYEKIKKYLDEQKEYLEIYFKYNKPTIICLFDKDLIKYVYDKKGNVDNYISYAFSSYMDEIPLSEIKKYINNGGYFYKENDYLLDNIFDKYIAKLSDKTFENDDLDKIEYIFKIAKEEGYDITYSSFLDDYMNYHSLTAQYHEVPTYSKIYYKLKKIGFKCYKYCTSEKFYK